MQSSHSAWCIWECGDTVCVISHFQSRSVMYGNVGIQCVWYHTSSHSAWCMGVWGYSVCDITLPVTQRDVWRYGDTVCVISHFQSLSVMYGSVGIQCVWYHTSSHSAWCMGIWGYSVWYHTSSCWAVRFTEWSSHAAWCVGIHLCVITPLPGIGN